MWVHRVTDVDVETKTGICSNCGPVDVYHKDKKRWQCRVKRNEEKRSEWLKVEYGISWDEREEIFEQQGRACAICQTTLQSRAGHEGAVVDHDHETGAIRGLLCSKCNRGLGCFKDDSILLRAAIEYLENRSRLL